MISREADFQRRILDYLVRHPDAKDTHEGVLTWWIGQSSRGEQDERDAVAALDQLVARGWLTKRRTATQPLYSLNRAHLEAIRTYLEQDQRTK
ncbi:MAG: hypothetical protein HRU82_19055 [Nitrospira sp.]|nr:MAG: hypothetical protein HRU82_19055 [Nitrospira sp.]